MSAVDFLDTNVLVYAVDSAQPDKRAMAQALIARGLAEQTATARPCAMTWGECVQCALTETAPARRAPARA